MFYWPLLSNISKNVGQIGEGKRVTCMRRSLHLAVEQRQVLRRDRAHFRKLSGETMTG
jgi:hypothetical protein